MNTPGGTPTRSTNPHLPQEGLRGYGGDQASQQKTLRNDQAGFSASQGYRNDTSVVANLAMELENITSDGEEAGMKIPTQEELERSFKALHKLRATFDDLAALTYSRKNVMKDIITKMQRLERTFIEAEPAIASMKKSSRGFGIDAQNQWSPKSGQLYLEGGEPLTPAPEKNVRKRRSDDSPRISPENSRETKKARRLKRKLEKDVTKTTKITEEPAKKTVTRTLDRPPKPAVKMKAKTVKRKFTRPTRPDTLVVKAKGECSYADILKSLRGDADLKNLGDSVTKIQKDAAGNLVLVLNRGAHAEMSNLRSIVERKLANKAEVTGRTDKMFIELRDLDELTSAEEICEAIKSQITKATDVDVGVVKSLRKAYRGTQTAVLALPADLAKAILLQGKLKVGWVISRAREKEKDTIPRCYRCLGFGHLARSCEGPDRSKQCFKCGESTHIAKDCKAETIKCLLCEGEPAKSHQTGSYSCPAYQQAVREAKQKK